MVTVYEERRKGAVAETIEHTEATFATCLEIIRRMDGFTRSQVTFQHIESIIMIGGGSHEFIVTVETDTALRNLLGMPNRRLLL
ncbi:hypothetical protein A8L34_00645 [Bacillus sp. FJAT-27264]|uniref:hypothetical protein n=1 Tax=Paenibacillus sp. (strain DSM 101736 / FJAT-27264) TaxID=1850362 RepID=UPI000807BBF5|nr:hypothetical protein [Bacillus sp. FJAT-27264]OBZ18130.1 hypothetical protein A8L34_00645 [Bacillus sp. FJAT-27264]